MMKYTCMTEIIITTTRNKMMKNKITKLTKIKVTREKMDTTVTKKQNSKSLRIMKNIKILLNILQYHQDTVNHQNKVNRHATLVKIFHKRILCVIHGKPLTSQPMMLSKKNVMKVNSVVTFFHR